MTTYVTDYSDEWRYVEGVTNAAHFPPEAATASSRSVKVCRGSYSRGELAGGFGLSPKQFAVVVWPSTLDGADPGIAIDSVLEFDSKKHRVVAFLTAPPDGSQMRLSVLEFLT